MNAQELVDLTNQRIGSLTLSELVEAIVALEDDQMFTGELLEFIRGRKYEQIGKTLVMWLLIYHQNDIELHGGL